MNPSPSLQLQSRRSRGFSLLEAVITIAVIGIMASIVVSAISNASRDAQRIVARQQQTTVQNALNAWVMSQLRVKVSGVDTAQVKSIKTLRDEYNTLYPTTSARFELLKPNASGIGGFLDQSTVDHFAYYTTGTDQLKTAALDLNKQHLQLPNWTTGSFPKVNLAND